MLGLAALGLALEATLVLVARASEGRVLLVDPFVDLLVLQFAAGLLYLLAVGLALRAPDVRRVGALVLGFAALFRATLVPAPPLLSTDLRRYVWEGRVVASGASPYAHAPDDPALAPLRDANWERVEHKRVPAVYGPLAEGAFAAAALLPGDAPPVALKGLFALADLGTVVVIARLLARRGRPRALALLYAWHPLPIVEVAGQGHLDGLFVLLLVLAIDFSEEPRRGLAGLALGLAAAVKYLPLVLVPALVRRAGWRGAVAFFAAVVACALPFVLLEPRLPEGVGTYASEWHFSATGYLAVERALAATGAGPALARLLAHGDEALAATWRYAQAPARLVVAALVALAALVLAKRRAPLDDAAFLVIALVLLLSPVVHPWYALWLLPFAAWRRDLAVVALGLAVPVLYDVLLRYDGTPASWREETWPRVLVLVSVAVPLVLRIRVRSRAGAPP